MNIACVLLAAGAGKRFGGDKLSYMLNGVSLRERALRLYGALPFCERILVIRPDDEAAAHEAKKYGFVAVVNPAPDRGVGSSAAVGTQALSNTGFTDGALYGVCDQPWLEAGSVLRLIRTFEQDPLCIVSLSFGGVRGNPVIFPKDLLCQMRELAGDVGGGAVIRKHMELLRLVDANNAREMTDLDKRPGTLA